MYAILGTIKVKPAHLEEFVEHVRRHAEHSVREPGCLRFDVLQDDDDPLTICLYEVFGTEADLVAHRARGYYKHWMEISREWREPSSGGRRILHHIHPPDTAWVATAPEVRS